MSATFRFTASNLYTKAVNGTGSWTLRGSVDDTVPITLRLNEERVAHAFDKDGKTPHVTKYFGVTGGVDGRLKKFGMSDLAILLHSVSNSGDLYEFGVSKFSGTTMSGYRVALKPVDTSDTSGVYIPQAVNFAEFVDVYSNTEYRRGDFGFVMIRRDGDMTTPLCQIAESNATTLLDDFPT